MGNRKHWLLWLAYTAVPLALFWFLDWTNAIHDTSLFAAILIAAGYRQILSGRMTGIQLPGATSKVWQPFEACDSLRADNPDIRTRVQNTLSYLANERAICVTASLANWKPSKNDGATQIDQRMKDWQAAWSKPPVGSSCSQ